MYQPPDPEPAPPRPRDPLAVGLGNASLLGVGYLMLGRWRLALGTLLVTVVLVDLLASAFPSVWFEVLLLFWWAALIAHGWWLAGGRHRTPVPRQWVIACCATIPVLLAVGLLRYDAVRVEHAVTEAREHGNCTQAVRQLDRVWFGELIADAPLVVPAEQTRHVCHRLDTARAELRSAMRNNDAGMLAAGVATLTAVLARRPGYRQVVDDIVDWFLTTLPTEDPCNIATLTDWLRTRQQNHDALDRLSDAVPRDAPHALSYCGDELMSDTYWTQAQDRYRQLLDRYPDSPYVPHARKEIRKASLEIQFDHVSDLLASDSYCSSPAKWEKANRYGNGVNRAVFFGNDSYTDKLPASWRTTGAADATLVVCTGAKRMGPAAQTCAYEDFDGSGDQYVTFHDIVIPVRAYALRTGRLVFHATIQITGSSCPEVISYYGSLPTDKYVHPSASSVRAAFAPVIT